MGTNITGIGNANAIGFKSRVTGGTYFPPELKDALVGVWSAYGKSNDSTDRNIIKNKIKDRGGDFVISNAAFKLNSGFGKYEEDFTSWDRIDASTAEISNDGSKIKCINTTLNVQYLFNSINKDIPSFKVKISNFTKGNIAYYYRKEDGTEAFLRIEPSPLDKVLELPKSYNTVEGGTGSRGGFYSSNINIGVTIEQIPSFEGAFVTDGVDDLITSTKTVQDMLGGSNEITVVSMAHFIKGESGAPKICRINQIRRERRSIRNSILEIGKSGIFGYTYKNGVTTINNILGDKNDCVAEGNLDGIVAPFSVEGYYYNNNSNPLELCSIAWYWTIIANKVLTTDQINQVIAYFNLDRTLKPDILCNIEKQGITNENHAEFGDKLIDFSGNGRDIQLNNLAWDGDSGIGKYNYPNWKVNVTQGNKYARIVYYDSINGTYSANFKGITDLYKSYGLSIEIRVNRANTVDFHSIKEDGIYTMTPPDDTTSIDIRFGGENVYNASCDITITQIPSHAGALCLDGVNDFGQFVGDLGLKDYTLIMNRAYNNLINNQVPLVSSNIVEDQTPFIVEHWNTGSNAISFSYGASRTTDIPLDINKKIVYQSTYSYMGYVIPKGNAISTGGGITLGKFGNGSQYSAICLWSLMSFPYSMSEFLIERQLKKHKLGTLYPNMVEFRPVIKANANYKITYYQIDSTNTWKSIKVGDYIVIGAKLAFQITFDNDASELKEVVSPQLSGIIVEKRPSNPGYNIYSYITSKSPQKINITIDEYIRYEDIVQPYPSIINLVSIDKTHSYTYGDKLKVGDVILYNSYKNLLKGLYSLNGQLKYNGVYIYDIDGRIAVAKEMVFSWTVSPTWLLDNNEPKVILSPSRLRIPNSSYKILGYIPDISGHGNHGVIHNSAYAEGSGVNEDGSYQFDGVDDFVTIPTLSRGGKQVLMKVNWNTIDSIIYDQRGSGGFAIYCSDYNDPSDSTTVPVYKGRNAAGTTYIDGIRNEYIIASQLRNVTHNIVEILDTSYAAGNINPIIGKSHLNANYGKMSLYDFALFDEVSTDEEIKQLNDIVGIEGGYVQKPPYYWDAYGKTNSDDDRSTIQQRGTAVGDYDITNYNHAYEGMSGYNGYPAVFGTNKTYANLVPNDGNFILTSSHNIINVTKFDISYGLLYSHIKLDGKLTSRNIDYPSYKIKVTGLGENFGLHYSYLKSSSDTTVKGFGINNDGIYIIPKSFASDGSLTSNSDWIGFIFTGTAPESCNVTIEVLPEYENGLVYDGVDDYSENTSIPAFTDYTYIIKYEDFNNPNTGSCIQRKGSIKAGGGAFVQDHIYRGTKYQYNFGISSNIHKDDSIAFCTKTNYNGTAIPSGNNTDDTGFTIGKFDGYRKMVFYKEMLYPRTVNMLTINMIKNMMAEDGIIDIQGKLFTDKFTGDFNLDFNKDFLIGN